MKHLRIIFILLLGISLFASCRKTAEEEISAPKEIKIIPKGEKVIFVGKHPECLDALLFKRMDDTYLRATHYPKEALQLHTGDIVYIIFEKMKLNDDDAQFATLPIEISQMTPAAEHRTPGLRSE